MKAAVAILALSSCSATATIAEETNAVRLRATSAQKHLAVVEADLVAIQAAAAEVHAALPGAEDRDSQLLTTIQYAAIGGAVMVAGGVIYTLIQRLKK
jgi:hypothetical protein